MITLMFIQSHFINYKNIYMIYFLSGINKLGPYSVEELKNLNLASNTLVYSDEWGSWQKIEDLPKLYSQLKNNTPNTNSQTLKSNKNAMKSEIVIKPIFFIFLSFFLSFIISLCITLYQRKLSLNDINIKINKCFENDNSIADYGIEGVNEGQFHKLKNHEIEWFNGEKQLTDEVGFYKTKTVYDITGNIPKDSTFFKTVANIKNYDNWNKITDYYDIECGKSDRSLSILKKTSDSDFSFNYVTFLDMAYYIPEYKSYDYGYGVSGKTPTYRPSLNEVYSDAALFLIEDSGAKYVKGSENNIWKFQDIETDFYKIGENYPFYIPFTLSAGLEMICRNDQYKNMDLFSFSKENGDYTYQSFNNEKDHREYQNSSFSYTYKKYITDNANVFDSNTIVWYCETTNNYHVEEKIIIFYKYLAIYTLIGFVIFISLYQIKRNFKRFKFI